EQLLDHVGVVTLEAAEVDDERERQQAVGRGLLDVDDWHPVAGEHLADGVADARAIGAVDGEEDAFGTRCHRGDYTDPPGPLARLGSRVLAGRAATRSLGRRTQEDRRAGPGPPRASG